MKWLLLLALYSTSTFARFTLEIGSPVARYSLNESGTSRTVLSDSGSELGFNYQYESKGAWTWGLGYFSQSYALDSEGAGVTLENDEGTLTKISAYIARGSKSGWFAQFGLDNTTASYLTEESTVISVEDQNRIDLYLKFGTYFKTGFGGGEISYKYASIPAVKVNGNSLAGAGTEVYFNLYFNKNKNFGLYFRYSNEFTSGDFDHVLDSRTFGLALAY